MSGDGSSTRAEAAFASTAAELMKEPNISSGSMFGSQGLKIGDKVFAMLVKGKLVVKLPPQRVQSLLSSEAGLAFDPNHGRTMKEWVTLKGTSQAAWLQIAKEAMEFVRNSRSRRTPASP